ncbi:MAG: hypothetical protein LBP62_03470 [Clostridiales bacterium]|jgi:hypothetical protein|nr:hypothetical protein [Clostridiales bacterium]
MKQQYSEAEKKENKRLLDGLLFAVGFCIISIAVGFGVFFGYCKPFEKWVYYECVVWNREIFEINANRVKVVYYVDNVKYENELHISGNDSSGPTRVGFYYNEDNPKDIMPYVRHDLLIIMPIVAIFGAALFTWYVVYYVKEKRKSKNI